MPTIFKSENAVINNTHLGWEPIAVSERLSIISSGFMLPNKDSAVI